MPRVLLVEPEEDVRNLMAVLLDRGGHDVVVTEVGRDAIEKLNQESFACLVVGSPVTVDIGKRRVMFLEYLEQNCPEIRLPIVVVTTWIDSSRVISAAQRLDACAIFAKPFSAADLIAAVGECAAGKRPAQRWYGIPDPPAPDLGIETQT